MNLFNKYIERIAKAQYDTACVLNNVEFDAYIPVYMIPVGDALKKT